MAQDLNLYVDVDNGRCVTGFSSTIPATLPAFKFGDSVPVIVRALTQDGSDSLQPYKEYDLTGRNIRLAIGTPAGKPSAGTFILTFGSDTTDPIPYGATATQIQSALNNLETIGGAGGVTVTSPTAGLYRIIWNDIGSQALLSADTSALFPTSGAFIARSIAGSGSAREVQTIKLEVQPAAYVQLEDGLPVASISITVIRSWLPGTGVIQTIDLSNPEPYAGSFALQVGGFSTVAITYNALATEVQSAIEATDESFAGKVAVTGAFPLYTVSFNASLGSIDQMVPNVSALVVPTGRKGSLDLNTTGIAELLSGASAASAKFEIEIYDTATSTPWTPIQQDVTVLDDVIPSSPASSTPLPRYLDESAIEGKADNSFVSKNVTIFGDSTADWVMPTEYGDPNDSEGIKNPKMWTSLLEIELKSRGLVNFHNKAVAGQRLEYINSTYFPAHAEAVKPLEGQEGWLIICAGHNDFNFGAEDAATRAAAVYSYAVDLRSKAVGLGWSKFLIVTPTWYHSHAERDIIYSRLVVADRIGEGGNDLWDIVIDQGYSPGFSVGWNDGVHLNTSGQKILFDRVKAEWIEGCDFLIQDSFRCGLGGVFPTIDAAIAWTQERRRTRSVSVFDVVGDILVPFVLPSGPSNVYGDGGWQFAEGGHTLNIHVSGGARLNIQREINYRIGTPPASVRIFGSGDLVSSCQTDLVHFGATPTTLESARILCPLNIFFFGQYLRIQSSYLEFNGSFTDNPALGVIYADNNNSKIIGPATTVIQKGSYPVINAQNNAVAHGIVFLPGCRIIRMDGGTLDTSSDGRVRFYSSCVVSNDTPASGSVWVGDAPAELDAVDW